MIYIKTQMQRIPQNCRECAFYLRSTYTERLVVPFGSRCKAKGGYIYGKSIEQHGGRPKWCPLREGHICD